MMELRVFRRVADLERRTVTSLQFDPFDRGRAIVFPVPTNETPKVRPYFGIVSTPPVMLRCEMDTLVMIRERSIENSSSEEIRSITNVGQQPRRSTTVGWVRMIGSNQRGGTV